MIRASASDTIVAVATPPGEGGIGVVRLSGPRAVAAASSFFRPNSGARLEDQKNFTARLGKVVSAGAVRVDESIAIVMRAPKSYTREDVVEIHAHGGAAVLSEIVALALAAGARLAEPGEFTKRAFLNGRLDLLQAEAVLDLIRSKTALARRWAASQLAGALSAKVKTVRESLVSALARLEASIDFPEEGTGAEDAAPLVQGLEAAARGVEELLSGARVGSLARRGLSAVILGPPNVGKSSLLNALVRRDRAIVTPHPGTTRDVVEEEIQIGGFPVRLSDTAGLRDTDHPIEREGIARSRAAAGGADLLLCVLDASRAPGGEETDFLKSFEDRDRILVLNKSDLGVRPEHRAQTAPRLQAVVRSSAVSEGGTRELEDAISRYLTQGQAELPEEAVVGTLRQRELLEKAALSVQNALSGARSGLSPELLAVDVRSALESLGQMTGEGAPDEVLDALFSRFCIGK